MIINNIKNSSSKIIGEVIIDDSKIVIKNFKKPILIIKDKEIITNILLRNRIDSIILKLYDEYYLNIGEIAALYEVHYSTINKQLNTLQKKTKKSSGRRNRSFGQKQTEETKNKISQSLKIGHINNTIFIKGYERTIEIKEKISNSLKQYYKLHPQSPIPHINNWKNGIYDKVDFHHGIGGKIFSLKNKKTIFFRSLLELYYILYLEENIDIKTYQYESLKIVCDDGHIYIPDFVIGSELIELKSKKHINSNDLIYSRFLYKKQQCEDYCLKNNLSYKVIFDTDLNYDTGKMKRYIKNNPEIINKYNIEFNQPERMVIK